MFLWVLTKIYVFLRVCFTLCSNRLVNILACLRIKRASSSSCSHSIILMTLKFRCRRFWTTQSLIYLHLGQIFAFVDWFGGMGSGRFLNCPQIFHISNTFQLHIELVSFRLECLFQLSVLGLLSFIFFCDIVQFARKFFSLAISLIFDQLDFVVCSLHRSRQSAFFLVPHCLLRLKLLNLILKVVHVDFHFVFKLF